MRVLERFWLYYVLVVLGLVGLVVGRVEGGLEGSVDTGYGHGHGHGGRGFGREVDGGQGVKVEDVLLGLEELGLRLDLELGSGLVIEGIDAEVERRVGGDVDKETAGPVIQAQLSDRIYPLTPPALLLKHSVVTATIVFYLYHYLCTLDYEVKYIWSRPWSAGTLLFTLNRYLPFVDLSICLHAIKVVRTPEQCLTEYSILTWVNTVGIIVSQIVLLLRTLAIWERKSMMGWCLFILFLCTVTPSLIIAHLYLKTLNFVPVNPLIKYGCNLESSSGLLLINYVLVLFSETTIVILTFIRGVKHLRHSNSNWVRELYASGFAFYVFLLLITIANLIFPFVASASLKSLFADPQRALHALLCNHVIFVICSRQRPRSENDVCELTHPTSRNFNPDDERPQHRHVRGDMLSTVLNTFATDESYEEGEGEDEYGLQDVDVDSVSTNTNTRRVEGEGKEEEDYGDDDDKSKRGAATATTLSGGWEEEERIV